MTRELWPDTGVYASLQFNLRVVRSVQDGHVSNAFVMHSVASPRRRGASRADYVSPGTGDSHWSGLEFPGIAGGSLTVRPLVCGGVRMVGITAVHSASSLK